MPLEFWRQRWRCGGGDGDNRGDRVGSVLMLGAAAAVGWSTVFEKLCTTLPSSGSFPREDSCG